MLDALGHLTYYRDKDVSSAGAAKETVRLLTATIKPDLEDSPNMRFCFRVVSPHKVYCLQAENQADRARWMEAVSTAIAGLLSNSHAIAESVADYPRSANASPNSKNGNPAAYVRAHGGGRHHRSFSVGSVASISEVSEDGAASIGDLPNVPDHVRRSVTSVHAEFTKPDEGWNRWDPWRWQLHGVVVHRHARDTRGDSRRAR